MRQTRLWLLGPAILLAVVGAGCDRLSERLGIGGGAPEPDGAPTEQELTRISYLSSSQAGPKGRKVYGQLDQAKTCGDLELATRWNRPPHVAGGPFHQKVVYLSSGVPADLPKDSEVFIVGRIESGNALSSGGQVWFLRLPDGTRVEAIEMANFWEKQAMAAQDSKVTAIVKPNKPGRVFCGQGVYQGVAGQEPGEDTKVPLVSVMFAMDRET